MEDQRRRHSLPSGDLDVASANLEFPFDWAAVRQNKNVTCTAVVGDIYTRSTHANLSLAADLTAGNQTHSVRRLRSTVSRYVNFLFHVMCFIISRMRLHCIQLLVVRHRRVNLAAINEPALSHRQSITDQLKLLADRTTKNRKRKREKERERERERETICVFRVLFNQSVSCCRFSPLQSCLSSLIYSRALYIHVSFSNTIHWLSISFFFPALVLCDGDTCDPQRDKATRTLNRTIETNKTKQKTIDVGYFNPRVFKQD